MLVGSCVLFGRCYDLGVGVCLLFVVWRVFVVCVAFMVLGFGVWHLVSCFVIIGSWFVVLGSWLLVLGPWSLVLVSLF